MNNFEFVGKIRLGKETEKFKPLETKTSVKGWVGTRLKFNVVNSTGFHMIESFEGYMQDNSSICYVLGKDKGKDGKFPRMQVKWMDRMKPEIVSKVASFSKYKISVDGQDFEYLAGADFVHKLVQILQDPQNESKRFEVMGDIEYNEYNGKVYKKFVPKEVKEVDESTPDKSFVKTDFFFTQGCVDHSIYNETKKYILDGFVRQYDGTLKKEIGYPEQLVIDASKAQDEKQQKMFEIIKKRFEVSEDAFFKCSIKGVQINGTEKKSITMDELTEEEKEMIEVGLATFEDFEKEYGQVNGDTIRECKVVGFAKGSLKSAVKTEFTMEDFVSQDVTEELTMVQEEVDEDLPF